MKKIRNIFILVFSLSFVFASCDDPYANEDFAAYTEEPMGIYLETNPNYTSWVNLLKKGDLYNALNVDNEFTCFVPNNAAVARYLQANGFASVDVLTEELAKSIAAYHIVPDITLSQGGFEGKISNRTASGDYLDVMVDKNDSKLKFVDGSKIINYDQSVINGIVHEIEDVLQPPLYTVGELLIQSERYKIFNEALRLCGIDDYLNLKETDVDNVKVKDFKTILAVSDSVFKNNNILTIDDLQVRYSGLPEDDRSDFYMFVAYHILPNASYDRNDLKSREDTQAAGKNFQTYAKNQFISITDGGGLNFFINAHTENVQVDSVYTNIKGNNGYIHEVDQLMNVSAPIAYPFYYEFTYGKEFEALDFYRGNNTRKYQEFTKNLEFIKWTTIPSKMGVIKYVNTIVTNMIMSHSDWLVVDFMTQIGSIDFTIPVIPPGKYKLTIGKWQYWHGVDFSTSRIAPGQVQTYFDDEKIGPILDHAHEIHIVELGEVTIREAMEHKMTFKLTKEGPLGFDRVVFTPIQ